MARCWTTGKHRSLAAVALAVCSAFAAACGVIGPHSCTLIGCSDSAAIHLAASNGAQRLYQVSLLINDEDEVTCESLTEPSPNATQTCSDSNVTITHQELADCVETRANGSVSQSCVPNGKFSQTINMGGTPTRVAVTLVDASGARFQRTFDLTYVTSRPNGPDCEPTCRQADAEWVVQ